jgi:hypothetical protein
MSNVAEPMEAKLFLYTRPKKGGSSSLACLRKGGHSLGCAKKNGYSLGHTPKLRVPRAWHSTKPSMLKLGILPRLLMAGSC